MVSFAIGKSYYTTESISKVKSFSIIFLPPEQMELAVKCGFSSGRDQDKLQEEEFTYQATGAPILSNCSAYLDCTLSHQFEVGDHVLFIGTVIKVNSNNELVLIYKSGDFFN